MQQLNMDADVLYYPLAAKALPILDLRPNKQRHSKQLSIDPDVLYYPLVAMLPSPPVVMLRPLERDFQAEYQAFLLKQMEFDFEAFFEDLMATSEDEPVEWTVKDVIECCDYLIDRQLQMLKDGRCGKKTRHEIALWVTNDSMAPFSFEFCCKYTGRDADALRSGFRDKYISHGFKRLDQPRGTH